MHECVECGKKAGASVFYLGRFICDHCHIRKNPPKMTLVIFKGSVGKPLFNTTTKSYEVVMTIKDLVECGWFIRETRENSGFKFYDMEYFGKKKCARCPKVDFPLDYLDCDKIMECKNQITRVVVSTVKSGIIGSEQWLG